MASVKLEMQFRERYLKSLTKEIKWAKKELEKDKSYISKPVINEYLSNLETQQRYAVNYFKKQNEFIESHNDKKYHQDKVSLDSFLKSYEPFLSDQYNNLSLELDNLKKQNQNRPQIQGNGSGSHIAQMRKIEKRMAELEEKMEFAHELNKEREEFLKSQSISGKVNARLSQFIDSRAWKSIEKWRYEEMDIRHKRVLCIGVLASQIEKIKGELQNPSPKKSREQIKKDFNKFVEKKTELFDLLKEVNKSDKICANVTKASAGKWRIIFETELRAHEMLSEYLPKIGIEYYGESLDNVISEYLKSTSEDIADFAKKYDKFSNDRKTWAEKVQELRSNAQGCKNSAAKETPDDLAM